jgi:hypothetical protein
MVFDGYAVRALVQRLRAKRTTVDAPIGIVRVRGYAVVRTQTHGDGDAGEARIG